MGSKISNHEALIEFFSKGKWEQNHTSTHTSGKSERVLLKNSEKYIVPDLMGQGELVEIEATTGKRRLYDIEGMKKILIIGVDSFNAFDEVYLFSVERKRGGEGEEALKFYERCGLDQHIEEGERIIRFVEQIKGGSR